MSLGGQENQRASQEVIAKGSKTLSKNCFTHTISISSVYTYIYIFMESQSPCCIDPHHLGPNHVHKEAFFVLALGLIGIARPCTGLTASSQDQQGHSCLSAREAKNLNTKERRHRVIQVLSRGLLPQANP